MDRFEGRLDQVFQDYKASVIVPEPGANFMPRLWERIEARRSYAFRWKKVAQAFVAASAVACLLMTGITVVSSSSKAPQAHATYVDVLSEAQPADNLTALGVSPRAEEAEANH